MKVLLWTYLNLNQVHFQNQLENGSVGVEFGEHWPRNQEAELWTWT